MNGEIIAVGEEVLSGDVVNSNASYLSAQLSDIGVFSRYHTVVGDVYQDIEKVLSEAVKRSKVILISGGLGPTKDDLTKEALAKFLGRSLYEDSELKEGIKAWFRKRNYPITENNFKQALMISGGQPLINDNGTAPGVYVEDGGVHIFLMPGPPGELKPMYKKAVEPIIKPLVEQKIMTKTYKMANIGESTAVTYIDDLLKAEEDYILAPYAKLGEVHFKVTVLGTDEVVMKKRMDYVNEELYKRLGAYIYSVDEKDMVDTVIDLLRKNNLTLGTAESCTGGMVADSFVTKPGVSDVYMEGAVTYSNASKSRNLGVSKELLETYGAVSEEVCEAMAKGVMERFNVDCAITTTGIAGPSGGTEEKPVGLVYIGIGVKGKVKVHKLQLGGNRSKIRSYSAKRGITSLYNTLKEMDSAR